MNTFEHIKQEVENIPSYILDDDIRLYIKFGELVPENGTILDVGTGLGKSMLCLALAAPQAMVFTFDDAKYVIGRNWAKDLADYDEQIMKLIDDRHLTNVVFAIEDVLEDGVIPLLESIDMLHIDCEDGIEQKVLAKFLPYVNQGGIILMRNYDRCSKDVDNLCLGCEYLEQKGKIQVIRKI